MRWGRAIFGIAVVAWLLGASIVAADPAITVSAIRHDANGASIIASGQGFPANQPVLASLVTQNLVYPLAYQGASTSAAPSQSVPTTDATGAFQNLTFALPVVNQQAGSDGQIFVSVGSVTARAPITLDAGIATGAGRGDKIAVSIGAAFLAIAVLLILTLLRGLPVYPIGQTTVRRARETEKT
ncbi:MAG: hypothetical protein ACYDAR_02370 [Thermomicrobiales bacterium]